MRFLIFIVIVSSALGASKVGVLSSGGAIKLRDVDLTPLASKSVPIVSGDYLTTSDAEATIRLNDRSVLIVDKTSVVGFERVGRQTVIYVWKGGVQIEAQSASPELSFCVVGTPVLTDAGSQGTIQVEGQNRIRAQATRGALRIAEQTACSLGLAKPVGVWGWVTPAKVVVLTGGAVGAGFVIREALEGPSQPPPVSPSQPQD